MFPDIVLCGATAPDAVPSAAVKITDAFETAFADLLVQPQPPTPTCATREVDETAATAALALSVPSENDADVTPLPVCAPAVNDLAEVAEPAPPLNQVAAPVAPGQAASPMKNAAGTAVPGRPISHAVVGPLPVHSTPLTKDAAVALVTARPINHMAVVPVAAPPVDDVAVTPVPEPPTDQLAATPALANAVTPPADVTLIPVLSPDLDLANPVDGQGTTPSTALKPEDLPPTQGSGVPSAFDEHDDTSEEATGLAAIGSLPLALPIVETPLPVADVRLGSEQPGASAPATPDADRATAFVADFTTPVPSEVVSEADVDETRTAIASATVTETQRPAKSRDLANPSLIARLTSFRSAEARDRLAAITALLAPEREPEASGRQVDMMPTRQGLADSPSPRPAAPAAFTAIDDGLETLGERVVTLKDDARVAPSLPSPEMTGKDPVADTAVKSIRKGTTSGGADTGFSPALLHASTPRLFAGLRSAEALRAPSMSAYEVLPNQSATARSIVQTLRLQASAGGGTAVITLAPEYLGSLTVSLRVVDGGVTATLHADNSSVRTWLDSNVPLLRDGLAEQGLRLEKVIVADTPEARGDAQDHNPEAQQRAPDPTRRPRRREERTFDVVV